jgi:hypothetical protein
MRAFNYIVLRFVSLWVTSDAALATKGREVSTPSENFVHV